MVIAAPDVRCLVERRLWVSVDEPNLSGIQVCVAAERSQRRPWVENHAAYWYLVLAHDVRQRCD
jgi:hypothetical protein